MSNDYHRPTLTFPKGGYNASQVRLYGIVSGERRVAEEIANGGSTSFEVDAGDYTIRITIENPEQNEKQDKKQKPLQHQPKRVNQAIYVSHITIEMKKMGTVVMTATMTEQLAGRAGGIISCGIIVGYAFEGHTYDLPKPKIMILPVMPEPIPEDDSGFYEKRNEDYVVWLVDKLDECAEFEMNQGFVEQLVLEANLPGKRAPNMYVGRMMLGHRSGKLTE